MAGKPKPIDAGAAHKLATAARKRQAAEHQLWQAVIAAREAGLSYAAIAKLIGRSQPQALELHRKAQRMLMSDTADTQ